MICCKHIATSNDETVPYGSNDETTTQFALSILSYAETEINKIMYFHTHNETKIFFSNDTAERCTFERRTAMFHN